MPLLRARLAAGPVRLPDRLDPSRRVPGPDLGAAPPGRVARSRRPRRARGDRLHPPGRRRAPATRAHGLPRPGAGRPGRPEQLVITSGAQGALAVGGRLWLGAGRRLAVEDPGSPHLQRTFAGLGIPLVHVRSTSAACPSTACPTTCPASSSRRPGRSPGRDDAGRPPPPAPRLGGRPPGHHHRGRLRQRAPLRGSSPARRCRASTRTVGSFYVGTFTKVLYPGLRTGHAVVPGAAVRPFTAQLEAAYRGPGAIEQRALALFIADGHFERHLGRLRAAFAERQAGPRQRPRPTSSAGSSSTSRAPGGTPSSSGSRTVG